MTSRSRNDNDLNNSSNCSRVNVSRIDGERGGMVAPDNNAVNRSRRSPVSQSESLGGDSVTASVILAVSTNE